MVYSGVPAKMLNRDQMIEIGPMSGKSNVTFWLERKGIEPTKERVERIFDRAKQSDSVLSDEEVMRLV
jgi:2-isopropylmalate synthase